MATSAAGSGCRAASMSSSSIRSSSRSCASIGNLAACSLTAFAFARLEFWGRKFWFALMLGTLMLPYQVVLIPQYVLFLNLGWVNSFLPLIVPKFLAVDAFFIFLMVQFFRGIPRELDEAAMMDGCSPWRIYCKVMLPLSVPVLVTAGIFTFIFTWDDFFAPLIYLNDQKIYTATLALRTFVDSTAESNWSGLFAMSVLTRAPDLRPLHLLPAAAHRGHRNHRYETLVQCPFASRPSASPTTTSTGRSIACCAKAPRSSASGPTKRRSPSLLPDAIRRPSAPPTGVSCWTIPRST